MVLIHNDATGINSKSSAKYFRNFVARKSQRLKSLVPGIGLEHFDIYRVLSATNLIVLTDVEIAASRQLNLAGNIKIKFRLKEDNAQHFSLLNGLFNFGKIPGVTVETKKDVRIFIIEASISQDEVAAAYFTKIFNLLSSEIAFRKNLLIIRERQRRIAAELNALYNTQFQAA